MDESGKSYEGDVQPGAHFTKHSYFYEPRYLVNSCETMPAYIRETRIICELICNIYKLRTIIWDYNLYTPKTVIY